MRSIPPAGSGLSWQGKAERAARHPYLVLTVVSVAVLLSALDLTVVTTILPQVIFDLRLPITKLDQAAWIITAYLLAYTATMPLMGRVSDLYGRRIVFAVALALFLAGSVLCAVSDSLIYLILARVVQALGGGAMVPVSMAIVGDVFPEERRGTALGIIGAVDTAGWVIGPLYGALLSQALGTWRWIFWINLPLGAIALILVLMVVSNRRPVLTGRGIDAVGAVIFAAMLAALNLGLSSHQPAAGAAASSPFAQETSILPGLMIPLLAAAAALLGLFIFVEWRNRMPMVDLGMFRSVSFSAANFGNLLVGAALILAMVYVPVFVTVKGGAPMESALAVMPLTLAMLFGALLGGVLSDRVGRRTVAVAGIILSSAAFTLMHLWTPDVSPAVMARDLLFCGLGFGLVIAPVGVAVIDSVRSTHYGIASAMVIIMRLVGMTAGLSAVTGWALLRINELLSKVPAISQNQGETLQQFQYRFANYYWQASVKITVMILNDVFLLAALLLAVAVVPAFLIARRRAR